MDVVELLDAHADADVVAAYRLGGRFLVAYTSSPIVDEYFGGTPRRRLVPEDGYAAMVAVLVGDVDGGSPYGGDVLFRAVTPVVWDLRRRYVPPAAPQSVVYPVLIRPGVAVWMSRSIRVGTVFRLASGDTTGFKLVSGDDRDGR